jgi:hypothetical protein
MLRKVTEITYSPYGQCDLSADPSDAEIETALREERFDNRNFQKDEAELRAEWQLGSPSCEEICERARQYHARRIAFFVRYGWSDPIRLKSDGHTVHDGLHRLRAAKFLGRESIDVDY